MAIEPNVFYTIEQAADRMQLSVEMVLFAEYDKKIEARRPPEGYRGRDGWDTADLCRERSQKLKQLQEKYGFCKEAQGELPESNN